MGTARSPEQILHHYVVEKSLAARLRNSTRENRASLYSEVYDELFATVPDHPQITKRTTVAERAAGIASQVAFLRPFIAAQTDFIEIGAGDCALSVAVSPFVRTVQAIDVSNTITDGFKHPANFRLHISKGTDLGVDDASISLAYSNQLIEHLHPDDAVDQMRNVVRALRPGGVYVCITPNRIIGPHDISYHFDRVATGLHLQEFSSGDLSRLMRKSGFSRVDWYVTTKGRSFRVPLWLAGLCETILSGLPHRVGFALGNRFPLRNLLNGIAVATM